MIAGLPYDAELEYLETTGTQYVDKIYEFPGTENSIRYEFGAILTQQTSTNQSFFFVPPSGNGARAMFYQAAKIFGSCDPGGGHSVSGVSIGTYFDAKVGFASDDSIIITVGSSTKHFSRTFYRCNHVLLFANNPRYSASAKLYYARVIVDSVLVRDLIPVRFTNELGQAEGAVYDRVSRKLFRNQGTGSFVIGPDKAATSVPVMGLHFMRRPRYTAKDYVQGGLVAMWDGIENAGLGVHDANATSWVDLSNNGHHLQSSDFRWIDNALDDTASNIRMDLGNLSSSFPSSITMESAVRCPNFRNNAFVFDFYNHSDAGCTMFTSSLSSPFASRCQVRNGNNNSNSRYSACDSNYNITTSLVWGGTEERYRVYFFGESKSMGNGASVQFITPPIYFVLGASNNTYQNFRGYVYSLRLYNRALTATEVAANYAIDKARFNLP